MRNCGGGQGLPESDSGGNSGDAGPELEPVRLGKLPGVKAELLRWFAGVGRPWRGRSATAQRSLRGGAVRARRARVSGGAGVEDGVQERLGWRLKEGARGLGVRAVGHAGERHGEDRGLC